MPERKKKEKNDLDEKKREGPSPFDGEKKDKDILDNIDDLIEETGEEVVKKRKDEEGE